MAWQKTMVDILRGLIDDLDPTEGIQEFTDARLEKLLVIASNFVNQEVDFPYTYTIGVVGVTISPCPVDLNDDGFVNLVCLKAACLLATGDFRKSSNKGMIIKDGPSSIDARTLVESKKELMESSCKNYNDAELEYRMGNSTAGQAIIGPHRADIINRGSTITNRDRPEFS